MKKKLSKITAITTIVIAALTCTFVVLSGYGIRGEIPDMPLHIQGAVIPALTAIMAVLLFVHLHQQNSAALATISIVFAVASLIIPMIPGSHLLNNGGRLVFIVSLTQIIFGIVQIITSLESKIQEEPSQEEIKVPEPPSTPVRPKRYT